MVQTMKTHTCAPPVCIATLACSSAAGSSPIRRRLSVGRLRIDAMVGLMLACLVLATHMHAVLHMRSVTVDPTRDGGWIVAAAAAGSDSERVRNSVSADERGDSVKENWRPQTQMRLQSTGDVSSTLSSLQSQLSSLQLLVSSHSSALSALTARLDHDAATNHRIVLTINSQLALLQSASTRSASSVFALALAAQTAALTQWNGTVSDRLAQVESAIGEVTRRIDEEEGDIAAAKRNITDIAGELAERWVAETNLTQRMQVVEAAVGAITSRVTDAENVQGGTTLADTMHRINITVGEMADLRGSTIVVQVVTGLQDAVSALSNLSGTSSLVRSIANETAQLSSLSSLVSSHSVQLSSAASALSSLSSTAAFQSSKPWCRASIALDAAPQLAQYTTVPLNLFTCNQSSATDAVTKSVFTWNMTASKIHLHGAVVGDADAGLWRRFALSANVRFESLTAPTLFDVFLGGANGVPSVTVSEDDGTSFLTVTLSGIVAVAPNSTGEAYLYIGHIASGGGAITPATYTFLYAAMI